ncbi:MAG: 4a-hydroxytetrahydrobiopterin dehydratase [Candidatus Poribacteria bacterium]|nr:4a-hydroxytetrahydrobiopterin dehydratase [Candidatus Poribacteria bacterium]
MAKLTEDEITAQLGKLDGWKRSGSEIARSVTCADFKDALMLINAVGFYAERANHHPGIVNVYNRVTFTLTTHDANGLTDKDFSLARQIDALLS